MHIQKLLAGCCIGALFGSMVAQGADTDIQAKAREQLRQAMMGADTNTNAPAAVPVAPTVPPPAPVAPAVSAPPAPVVEPAAVAPVAPMAPAASYAAPAATLGSDTPAQIKAREELRKAMLEAPTTPVAPVITPVPAATVAPVSATPPVLLTPTTPEPAIAPAPVPVAVVPAAAAMPVATTNSPYLAPNPEAQAKALEALHQEENRLNAEHPMPMTPATPMASASTKSAPLPATRPVLNDGNAYISTQTGMPVHPAASTYAAGSKEQRLDALLQLYKTDQISPADYHAQRAKIVAEP